MPDSNQNNGKEVSTEEQLQALAKRAAYLRQQIDALGNANPEAGFRVNSEASVVARKKIDKETLQAVFVAGRKQMLESMQDELKTIVSKVEGQ